MITPMQARALIHRNISVSKVCWVPLVECLGLVLAADIQASFPMPIADNSAMDGFVIRSKDVSSARIEKPVQLRIKGTIKAGDSKRIRLAAGTTSRIMTGAFIPQGSDAVLPKEEAMIVGGHLVLNRPVTQGQHIRYRAEEIKKGERLLKKGTLITPSVIGILASLGLASAPAYPKPKLAVLATGNELIQPGEKLRWGKIYDSNSWMIRAALTKMGLEPVRVVTLPDKMVQVRTAIRRVLQGSDYVILLGGVSVGDYDVVKAALEKEGVQTIFWKVNQKPGKPLYFGRKNKARVFGLPGNPAAAFTCFYEYVYPALRRSLGHSNPGLDQIAVKIKGDVRADSKRHLFLKARVTPQKASQVTADILPHQGSHMLSSLAEAQGFVHVAPRVRRRRAQKSWTFHFLPGAR